MLSSFSLKNFRGCTPGEFYFGEKTYIEGVNGSGKTHILEGIHLLCQGGLSYNNLPLSHETFFEARWKDESGIRTFTRYRDENSDIYTLQGKKITRINFIKNLPFRTVFLSPFDMNLLYFAPSMRRDYMDHILEQRFHQFRDVRREYEKIVRSRNALLKSVREGYTPASDLDFWDLSFAKSAHTYLLYRERYMDFVRDTLPLFSHLLPKYCFRFVPLICEYEGENRIAFFENYLREKRERDILSGHTHIGPHRDDFEIHITSTESEDMDVKNFLSRGEMKLLLLTLKCIEVAFLDSQDNKSVILLIDDIFAELDEKNICRFMKGLTTYQSILTSQKPLPNGENWSEFTCINLKDS